MFMYNNNGIIGRIEVVASPPGHFPACKCCKGGWPGGMWMYKERLGVAVSNQPTQLSVI